MRLIQGVSKAFFFSLECGLVLVASIYILVGGERMNIMDDYVSKSGTVIASSPGFITVRIDKDGSDCEGCKTCPMCRLCRGKEVKHLDLPITVPEDSLTPQIGDTVRIGYHSANPALAATVLFVPTLLGLLAGGWLGTWLGGDGIFLLGCAVGVVAGLAVTYGLSQGTPSLKAEAWLER